MRVRNESERIFIIKGVRLEVGRVMEIADEEGRKLCEAYKGELVSLDDLQTVVVIPEEEPAKEEPKEEAPAPAEVKKTTKKAKK